jgi:two-component system, response regulator, stage 0 sporulation protein F
MPDTRQASVLIVEDEPDFREMLNYQFSAKGYRSFVAAGGPEALELVWTHHVSAVVTDIRMPRMDGIELAHRIKSVDVHKPAVILVSAYPDIAPEDAYNEGAEGLFTKPFPLADIVDTVGRLTVPLGKRWRSPLAETPLHEITLTLRDVHSGQQQTTFALGRGGLHLATEDTTLIPGQRTAFDVRFEDGPFHRLAGIGTVRWARPEGSLTVPPACGIEFEFVEKDGRDTLVHWLATQQLTPYIPSLYAS